MVNKFLVLAAITALGGAWLLAQETDDKKNSSPTPRGAKGKPASQPWSKRPPGEGSFGGGGHAMRPSADQEQRSLDFLKNNRPEQYAQLTRLRDSNPERYNRTLRMVSHWMESMEDMPDNVKKAAFARQDAQIEIADLVPQIRATSDPAAKAALMTKLRTAVNKHLDGEQTVREYRLSMLHKQILQMQEDLQKNREQRAQLVEEQVEMYLKSSPPRPQGDRPDRPDKPPFRRSGSGGFGGGPRGGK